MSFLSLQLEWAVDATTTFMTSQLAEKAACSNDLTTIMLTAMLASDAF